MFISRYWLDIGSMLGRPHLITAMYLYAQKSGKSVYWIYRLIGEEDCLETLFVAFFLDIDSRRVFRREVVTRTFACDNALP